MTNYVDAILLFTAAYKYYLCYSVTYSIVTTFYIVESRDAGLELLQLLSND